MSWRHVKKNSEVTTWLRKIKTFGKKKMSCKKNREAFDVLIEWILSSAKSAAEDFQKDKDNPFYQGLAQGYTEILDYLNVWGEINDYTFTIDLEKFTVEELA